MFLISLQDGISVNISSGLSFASYYISLIKTL